MKTLLLSLLMLLVSFSVSAKDIEVIFKADNFFAVTTEFNEQLLDEFARKVMLYDKNEMFIYFHSPGGSVFSLTRMLSIMETSNIKFICVARYAASAAFIMFEYCNERYLLPDGILMSHNASGFEYGELPRMKARLEVFEAIIKDVNSKVASRLKMSLQEYENTISNELWLNLTRAEKYHAVDGKAAKVSCAKDIVNKKIKRSITKDGFLGPVTTIETFSYCPLLTEPIAKLEDDE